MPPNGICEITFTYLAGSPGARIDRVALAFASEDTLGRLTEISTDRHAGYTGKRHFGAEANVYTVELGKRRSGLHYFITADIKAEETRLCNGAAWIKALAPHGWDPLTGAAQLRPMTDQERAEVSLPKFSGEGLRVGVVAGGTGSAAILAHLRCVDGIAVTMLSHPTTSMIEACQVVVLPLLNRDESGQRMAGWLQDAFRDYVHSGGGLVMTAALGKMGLGDYADVCTFKRHGGSHDFVPWVVVDEHPVSHGMRMHEPLPGTGFSVEYDCGPNGLAVALSAETRDPVVVAGDIGEGRVVVCGLDIKLEEGRTDAMRKLLIENAVRWCARPQQAPDAE
jgi:hypothetical protein